LIIYFHNEYLKYIEYKVKFEESYVGLSFVIKNILNKKESYITLDNNLGAIKNYILERIKEI